VVTREQQVTQSVQDFVKAGLSDAGYDGVVKIRDAFPTMDERSSELLQTTISLGFKFDDGGRLIELGSDLTMRQYTIEFWVFGRTSPEAENVANVIRAIVERAGGLIPLKDIGAAGQPVIDQLMVDDSRAVTVTRQLASNPLNWDRFVFTTTVKVEDIYYPSLVT
jgi:hypothetical protein